MNKTICAAMIALGVLCGLNSPLFAFAVSYDQKVSVNQSPIATIKVIVKDEKMHAESNFGGMTSVMIRNESGVYSYLPAQKMATKIPASMDRPNLTRDLPHFMDFLNKNGATKIGSEKIAAYDCDIYKFTEPTIKKDAKAWIWKEKGFPVKIEVNATEGLTVVELTNIQFTVNPDDATFKLPADAKIIDLEKGPGGLGAPPPPPPPVQEETPANLSAPKKS